MQHEMDEYSVVQAKIKQLFDSTREVREEFDLTFSLIHGINEDCKQSRVSLFVKDVEAYLAKKECLLNDVKKSELELQTLELKIRDCINVEMLNSSVEIENKEAILHRISSDISTKERMLQDNCCHVKAVEDLKTCSIQQIENLRNEIYQTKLIVQRLSAEVSILQQKINAWNMMTRDNINKHNILQSKFQVELEELISRYNNASIKMASYSAELEAVIKNVAINKEEEEVLTNTAHKLEERIKQLTCSVAFKTKQLNDAKLKLTEKNLILNSRFNDIESLRYHEKAYQQHTTIQESIIKTSEDVDHALKTLDELESKINLTRQQVSIHL
jgi:hypothetical protein